MLAEHRSRRCYSRCLLNIDHSVVNVCQTSTIQCSQCLLTIERLVDVYETFVLLLSIDKEAMFSKHWLFVEDHCFWWVKTIIIPLIFSKHLLFATSLLKYAFWDKRHPIQFEYKSHTLLHKKSTSSSLLPWKRDETVIKRFNGLQLEWSLT